MRYTKEMLSAVFVMERGQLSLRKHALTDCALNCVSPPGALSCAVFFRTSFLKQGVVLMLYFIEQNSPFAAIHRSSANRESFRCELVTSVVISGAQKNSLTASPVPFVNARKR